MQPGVKFLLFGRPAATATSAACAAAAALLLQEAVLGPRRMAPWVLNLQGGRMARLGGRHLRLPGSEGRRDRPEAVETEAWPLKSRRSDVAAQIPAGFVPLQ